MSQHKCIGFLCLISLDYLILQKTNYFIEQIILTFF